LFVRPRSRRFLIGYIAVLAVDDLRRRRETSALHQGFDAVEYGLRGFDARLAAVFAVGNSTIVMTAPRWWLQDGDAIT
jgi:hypothetical protein